MYLAQKQMHPFLDYKPIIKICFCKHLVVSQLPVKIELVNAFPYFAFNLQNYRFSVSISKKVLY